MTLVYNCAFVFFQEDGSEEGDGTHSTELMDDGALELKLSYFHGNDAVLTALLE